MSVYVYHELQESLLCGQHCLNNLVQEPFFAIEDLAAMAQELDRLERSYITDMNDILQSYKEGSGNVDESGNFSFQVLKVALERTQNLQLLSWTGEEGRTSVQDPTSEKAFIINHKSHWYTIRKINENWWDLNSMKPKPELISPFYLSACLSQLRAEGSSIFLVRGNLSPSKSKPDGHYPENCRWYTETSLLDPTRAEVKDTGVKPFSGASNRLGSRDGEAYFASDFKIEPDDDDDVILAKTLSASAAEAQMNAKKPLTPAELRLKRLEALQSGSSK